MIEQLVICGGNSDVVARFVAAALEHLRAAGQRPERFGVLGVARDEWDDDGFRERLAGALDEYAPEVDADVRDAVVASSRYHRADTTNQTNWPGLSTTQGRSPCTSPCHRPSSVRRSLRWS